MNATKKLTIVTMDVYEDWANFLWKNAPNLMTKLNYNSVSTVNYYTRVKRYPEIKDRRLYFNTYGLMSECSIYEYGYSNEHMFRIEILTLDYGIITYSLHITEFLTPLMIGKYPNELFSSGEQKSGFSPKRCWKDFYANIIWDWLQDCIYMKLCRDRIALLKRDLIAAAWHPTRVAKWVDAGISLEDM